MKSLWMLVAGLGFALLAACVKLAAGQRVPVEQIVFYRSLLSVVSLYGFMRWRGVSVATPLWKEQSKRSITGVLALAAYFFAIKLLPLATAVTLNYSAPIFIGLLLMVSKRLPARPGPLIAIATGFAGVVLLQQPTYDSSAWLGYLLALSAALLGAIYTLDTIYLGGKGEPSARTVFYFAVSSTIVMLPWYLASNPVLSMSASAVGLIIAVGILATASQLLATFSFQQGEPFVTASLGYSQVVFSSAIGMWIWHDALPAHVWLGILLIVGSGIMTTAVVRK